MSITESAIGCLVVNATSGPITDLKVVHTRHDAGSDQPPPTTLQAFETSFFGATIVSGSSDEWSVSCTASGAKLSGSTRCDIEKSDLDHGAWVIIALYDASVGFSIIPPVSSACLHNSYDSNTLAAVATPPTESASSWSGSVQCLIFNATGDAISDLQVSHTLAGSTQSPPVSALDNGGTLLYTIASEGWSYDGSNQTDEWSVSFVIGNTTLQRSGKQCTIEEEDFEANSCVIIALYNALIGFSIITPVSKPCLNNEYE